MANLLQIGLSGIQANQIALATTGHNITNAQVEGYTRQQVEMGSLGGNLTGQGFFGAGVGVNSVERAADDILTERLRDDTASFKSVDSFLFNANQADGLLANTDTGIATAMNDFFSALQISAEDPASPTGRQIILGSAESLSERFNNIYSHLNDQNTIINSAFETVSLQVTALAGNIAALNKSIDDAMGQNSNALPNDLLDKRDQSLLALSELVGISTTINGNSVNVFLSTGESLVLNSGANSIETRANPNDPYQNEILLNASGRLIELGELGGGELGGLYEYRDTILIPTLNRLGRLSVSVADNINTLQSYGVDIEGNVGSRLFADINEAASQSSRVLLHSGNNPPDDRRISVAIDDTSALTISEYKLSFIGPGNNTYSVTRESDNSVVALGQTKGTYPDSITIDDGFTINLTSGSFQQGDQFTLIPTRFAATQLRVEMERSEELAFAIPIRTESSLGNEGTASIGGAKVLDVYEADGVTLLSAFANPGELDRPLIVKFTSDSTYEILDNSNPNAPIALDPPISARSFLPGQRNLLFSEDPLAEGFISAGARTTTYSNNGLNNYENETLTFTDIDVDTGFVDRMTYDIEVTPTSKPSAREIANGISAAITDVQAFAHTSVTMEINDSNSLAANEEYTLLLNDIQISTDGTDNTVLSIADVINQSDSFQKMGIFAFVDQSGATDRLTVKSVHGDDLRFSLAGSASQSDSFTITAVNGGDQGLNPPATTVAFAGIPALATVGGRVELELGGGITMATNGGIDDALIPVAGGSLFSGVEVSASLFFGYQSTITGDPSKGDEFYITYNDDSVSDNRNALSIIDLQTQNTLHGGSITFNEDYGQLVAVVGALTNQARINTDAALGLLQQSQGSRDQVSAVSLDEEAALLIQFEQAYNASAQVITVARTIFDTLLNAVG